MPTNFLFHLLLPSKIIFPSSPHCQPSPALLLQCHLLALSACRPPVMPSTSFRAIRCPEEQLAPGTGSARVGGIPTVCFCLCGQRYPRKIPLRLSAHFYLFFISSLSLIFIFFLFFLFILLFYIFVFTSCHRMRPLGWQDNFLC